VITGRLPCLVQDYRNFNNLYGLEKFWAYHHYGGVPKDQDIQLNEEVWWVGGRLNLPACTRLLVALFCVFPD